MKSSCFLLVGAALASGCGSGATSSTTTYSLTLQPGAHGTLSADPAGPGYASGTRVTLTATPDPLWMVQLWSGTENDASTALVNHVIMNGDRTVAVQFTAPADCPVDAQTGNAVARMLSPANGTTLPAGAVTFQWCNANADYFLTIESIPGAHDIFFAFAGGPGAGIETLTLGPGCVATPPTGCVPARGEPIYVTLYTLKHGNILPPSPFQYSYTAANASP